MNINHKLPQRIFKVGSNKQIEISHSADIQLEDNEQITLVSQSGTEFDIVRKNWGYYLAPSLNVRLRKKGFWTVLVKQRKKIFLLIVNKKKQKLFKNYIKLENYKIIKWLDKSK